MKPAIAVASLVIAMAGTAAAQPGLTTPTPALASTPSPAPSQPALGGERSEGAALGLSLGGTAASWTMLAIAANEHSHNAQTFVTIGAFGTLLAPTLGHWYAGSIFTRGLGLRLLGAGAAVAGLAIAFHDCFLVEDCSVNPAAPVLGVAGAILYAGGTVDDIVTAPGAARRHNQRLRDVSLVPVPHRAGGGLAIVGKF